MAHALFLYDSELALSLLKRSPRMEHSPIGLLLRGQDGIFRGEDEQDLAVFEKAVLDLEYVQFLLPENPGAVMWYATAVAHTIEFAESHDYDHNRLDELGRLILNDLPQGKGNASMALSRWKLCRALGDKDGAWEAVQEAAQRGCYCWNLAVECLTRFDSSATAEQAFEDIVCKRDQNDPYVRLAKAFIVHDSPNGPTARAYTCRWA